MARIAILNTTIRVPTFLDELLPNVARYGHRDVAVYVIGDRKTPPEAASYCRAVSERYGIPVEYLDLAQQRRRLADFPELDALVPENTYVRRLPGHLLAYLDGCEVLISVDDDNFPTDADFVGAHAVVGSAVELPVVASDTGWYNVYEALIEERGIPIFPRGFPWRERRNPPGKVTVTKQTGRVVVTSGFVLDDPDVDAITRLFWPVRTVGLKPEFTPRLGLAPGTWASFNNQNAAFSRELIPVYYTPVATGRNADIWTSFVICRLAGHMGDVISFGEPLARQLRNPHNLWRDLEEELPNNRATDRFVEFLRGVPLEASTYLEALGELISGALARLAELGDAPAEEVNMMRDFFTEYQVWQRLFARMVRV